MKKSTIVIATFFLLISLHFACKQSNMSDLMENEPISNDSIRILDSINMAMAVADSINMVMMEKLTSQSGTYEVTCRVKTTDIIPDSLYGYLEVPVDSFFTDTLVLDFIEDSLVHSSSYLFPESTIFASTKLLQHGYPSYFFLQLEANTIKYKSTEDSYMCKCGGLLRLEGDSVYYRYFNGWSSFDISVVCTGTKIN